MLQVKQNEAIKAAQVNTETNANKPLTDPITKGGLVLNKLKIWALCKNYLTWQV